MGRNIVHQMPASGLNVQRWLADAPEASDSSFQQVARPACAQLHLVNPKIVRIGPRRTMPDQPILCAIASERDSRRLGHRVAVITPCDQNCPG